MSGIDRLRGVAHVWNNAELRSIADQIEREGEEYDRRQSKRWTIVWWMVREMEQHVSGVEGAEDSPVARWARELREALKSDTSDGSDGEKPSCAITPDAADVTSDAQKVTREDAEAIAWVREHGGIAYVRDAWNVRSNLDRQLEKEQAKVKRQQRHIEFVQNKCRERRERIEELERRLSEAVSAQLASDAALYDLRREVRDVCEAHGIDPGEDPLRAIDELRDEAEWAESLSRILDGWADLLGFPEQKGDPGKITARVTAVLNRTWRRLMPEGMEWPRFEDGEPVKFGDVVSDGDETGRVYYVTFDTVNPVIIGFTDETPDQDPGTWLEVSVSDGERVKRPAPKVLDADGAEIHEGDEVWPKYPSDRDDAQVIRAIVLTLLGDGRVEVESEYPTGMKFHEYVQADQLTHRAPVLAADGKPLREGERVWLTTSGREIRVDKIEHRPDGFYALELFADGSKRHSSPVSILAHEQPDTWERIEEDAGCTATKYNERRGTIFTTKQQVARDLVRRAKALAERDV